MYKEDLNHENLKGNFLISNMDLMLYSLAFSHDRNCITYNQESAINWIIFFSFLYIIKCIKKPLPKSSRQSKLDPNVQICSQSGKETIYQTKYNWSLSKSNGRNSKTQT